jgi:hypothetical protein
MYLKITDNHLYLIFMEPVLSINNKEARQGNPYVQLLLISFHNQFSC